MCVQGGFFSKNKILIPVCVFQYQFIFWSFIKILQFCLCFATRQERKIKPERKLLYQEIQSSLHNLYLGSNLTGTTGGEQDSNLSLGVPSHVKDTGLFSDVISRMVDAISLQYSALIRVIQKCKSPLRSKPLFGRIDRRFKLACNTSRSQYPVTRRK